MFGRRTLLAALAAGAAPDSVGAMLAEVERRSGGQLGVAIIWPDRAALHRGDERFPLCSTYKLLAAACTLARVEHGEDGLDRPVVFGRDAIIAHSPVTAAAAGQPGGLTVRALCAAAVSVSDNAAANLLVDRMGGPARLTAALRGFGDTVTRLDRREPELNQAAPGDVRDTTTPRAMAETVQRLVLGDALSPESRELLRGWLIANETGARKLRAGLPEGWTVGDRTGAGDRNATNDVAAVWPPGRPPFVIAAYLIDSRASDEARDATLAAVGRIAAES